ncbi:MAG: hypothetical protein EXR79_05985 [Myxococcales bacterium]|nr:hypothetical protein [Myxococcales bacterium]
MSSVESLLREVRSVDGDACARGLRRLSRHCGTDSVTDARPPDWQARRDQVIELAPRLLELATSADVVLRELAADALGSVQPDGALDALLALCGDAEERVRATALGALEGWPDERAARDRLLDAMCAKAWLVRLRAAKALRPFAGDAVDDALLEALTDPDSHVRSLACESLKRRDPGRLRPRLRVLVTTYPAPHLLDAAMDLLGAAGTAEDVAFLKTVGSWLNLSQPGFIRAWARKAARAIRARQAGGLST